MHKTSMLKVSKKKKDKRIENWWSTGKYREERTVELAGVVQAMWPSLPGQVVETLASPEDANLIKSIFSRDQILVVKPLPY